MEIIATPVVTLARGLATALVVASAALAAAQPAAASWSQQPTPASPGATQLTGVSCSSASACTAVGPGVAERWDGTGWTLQGPDPSVALTAVSCPSGTACVAVGTAGNMTGAESWNGSSWTVQSTPNPAAASSSTLVGVSCTSATACIAVGSYKDSAASYHMLAEGWNGASWTSLILPTPTGATQSQLSGVSCTSASACTVVGSYTDGAGSSHSLAEAWNGTTWTVQSAPGGGLGSVSCVSAKACVATGAGVSERWNGTIWTLQKIATPPNSTANPVSLSSVSCSSPRACEGVGTYSDDAVATLFAEAWNGSSWKVLFVEVTTSMDSSYLNSVSCASATVCTAVGSYHDPVTNWFPLAAGFSTSWTLQNTAGISSPTSELDGVSCKWASGTCVAVGRFLDSAGNFETLAEYGYGTGWSILSTPLPAGSTSSALDGVSCWSVTGCTAVGYYIDPTIRSAVPLAETWNGASWALQSVPSPSGASGIYLNGVSCASASACVAVGRYVDGSGYHPLVETWNGSGWTLQSIALPAGGQGILLAVSCRSASACTTVGEQWNGASAGTLAAFWNGAGWTIRTTPNPAGATQSFLTGVSCTSASACTAVGSYTDSAGTYHTLAEVSNGATWTIQSTPNLAGATDTSLHGVSCTSPTACTAVGSWDNGSLHSGANLAEAWDGSSWAIQSAPDTSGETNGAGTDSLSGISCTSAITCTAVGVFADFPDVGTDSSAFAEQYS